MAKAINGKHKVTQEDLVRIDKWAAQYVALRDRRRELKKQYEEADAPFAQAIEQLGLRMMNFLDQTGQKSAKTAEGTVTINVRHDASLHDPDEFMEFIRESGLLELMDRRANTTACRTYAEEHGSLPPGVTLNSMRHISVRAPS